MKASQRLLMGLALVLITWIAYQTGRYSVNTKLINSLVTSRNYQKGGFAFYVPLSLYSNATNTKLYRDYLIGREKKNREYNLEAMFYCRQITDTGLQVIEVQQGDGAQVKIGNDYFNNGEKI